MKVQTNKIQFYHNHFQYLNCRLLEARTKKENTCTGKNAVNDTDEYLTTTEKVTHSQTAEEKENAVTVVLIVLIVLLLMIILTGVLIVYLWKTRLICYEERSLSRKGMIYKCLSFLNSSYLSLSIYLSFSRIQIHDWLNIILRRIGNISAIYRRSDPLG